MSAIYDGDDWIVSTVEAEDGDIVIRSRASVPPPVRRASHPQLVLIQWPYESAGTGLPDDETEAKMIALEDALHAAADEEWGVEAASITGCGMREWRYYTPDASLFTAEFSKALEAHDPFPIELSAFDDPDWNGLAEVLPAFRAD